MSKKAKRRQKQKANRTTAAHFFESACSGDIEQVQLIVKQGQDIEAQAAGTGLNALMLASKHGRLDVVEFLISSGANVAAKDDNGATALMLATLCGHLPVVQGLVGRSAEIGLAASDGKTPLLIACEMGHHDIFRFLVENGADVNACDAIGVCPLIAASAKGDLETVKYLVETAGVDVNATDEDGDSALAYSGSHGHAHIVSFLVEHGAAVGFHTSAMIGDLEAVIRAVEEGQDVNALDDDGATALMGASTKGHSKVVDYLLLKGADANIVAQSLTALLMATSEGHLETVQRLVAAGADLHAKTQGLGPLEVATAAEHPSIVEYLHEAMASENKDSTEGRETASSSFKPSQNPLPRAGRRRQRAHDPKQ